MCRSKSLVWSGSHNYCARLTKYNNQDYELYNTINNSFALSIRWSIVLSDISYSLKQRFKVPLKVSAHQFILCVTVDFCFHILRPHSILFTPKSAWKRPQVLFNFKSRIYRGEKKSPAFEVASLVAAPPCPSWLPVMFCRCWTPDLGRVEALDPTVSAVQ